VSEPQTPASAESKLTALSEQLEEAERALAAARDAEVDAETARDAAKRKWTLHPECPVVARNAFTVAYRDAWVGEMCDAEETAYRLARKARQAAQEHLRRVEKQAMVQQSIAKSVGTSYQGTRSGERWS
jgi:hypothetical protein